MRVNVTNAEGRLYAYEDACTHMGCSLAEGEFEGVVVTCPCHGSQFDVTTGAVLRGPANRPVQPIGLTIVEDQIRVETGSAEA
jgi:nitrite reductase/ring-hydroxylating ferredoxin subunit